MTSALAVLRTVRPVRLVSIRYRDSGVMMRIWGGCFTMRCRSFWGVSPVRMPTLILPAPSPPVKALMPSKGLFKFSRISPARDLSGET